MIEGPRDDTECRVPIDERKKVLSHVFDGWPGLIAGTLAADIDWNTGFFGRICQVEAERWSRGRVVLLGDAAHCLTFLSGQGTSMAMVGAYILAQELAAHPFHTAFHNYEARLRPMTIRLQRQSRKIGGHYVPRSRCGIRLQSYLAPLLTRPPLVRLMAKRLLANPLSLDR